MRAGLETPREWGSRPFGVTCVARWCDGQRGPKGWGMASVWGIASLGNLGREAVAAEKYHGFERNSTLISNRNRGALVLFGIPVEGRSRKHVMTPQPRECVFFYGWGSSQHSGFRPRGGGANAVGGGGVSRLQEGWELAPSLLLSGREDGWGSSPHDKYDEAH